MKPPAPVTRARTCLDMVLPIRLVTAVCQDGRNREQQDLEIRCERDALRVRDIELGVLVHLAVAARLDLPQAGDAGLDRMPGVLPGLIARNDLG